MDSFACACQSLYGLVRLRFSVFLLTLVLALAFLSVWTLVLAFLSVCMDCYGCACVYYLLSVCMDSCACACISQYLYGLLYDCVSQCLCGLLRCVSQCLYGLLCLRFSVFVWTLMIALVLASLENTRCIANEHYFPPCVLHLIYNSPMWSHPD